MQAGEEGAPDREGGRVQRTSAHQIWRQEAAGDSGKAKFSLRTAGEDLEKMGKKSWPKRSGHNGKRWRGFG